MSQIEAKQAIELNKLNDPDIAFVLPCPFCGSEMEPGHDPLYAQVLYHPKAECFFSQNMFYHADLWNLWNQRRKPSPTENQIINIHNVSDRKKG